ncbi:MAG TPA: hypothetical protein VF575_05075 [Candidatus Saccharimonadales bacterium]|jgi:hypothetical protein
MPNWLIALMFGLGVAGWTYTKLVHANGNPTPSQDLAGAAIAGTFAFIFLFTLLKFVFNF